MLAGQSSGHAAARAVTHATAIVARVAGVGAEVFGRKVQQHEDLLLRVVGIGRGIGCLRDAGRGEPQQHGQQRTRHGAGLASSDSASDTAGCARSRAIAAAWPWLGTLSR